MTTIDSQAKQFVTCHEATDPLRCSLKFTAGAQANEIEVAVQDVACRSAAFDQVEICVNEWQNSWEAISGVARLLA